MVDSHGSASTAEVAGRELIFTRIFDAPREMVFDAWTNPEHVAKWWGPRGFTSTIEEMDVRPGGVWRLVMHGPDGTDYRNRIIFREVTRPERLVYEHVPEKDTEPVSIHVTVTFEARGSKTHLSMRMRFPSEAAREHVMKKYGAFEGAQETLARLDEYLAK